MRIHFTRTVTHEFSLEVTMPADVQADLDVGMGLEGLSEEGKVALYQLLSDNSQINDATAIDAEAPEVLVFARGTETPMLGNLRL